MTLNNEILAKKGNLLTIGHDKNPAEFCICGAFIGYRGFCSKKCHDKYYDQYEKISNASLSKRIDCLQKGRKTA
jgi:hypothetical protein